MTGYLQRATDTKTETVWLKFKSIQCFPQNCCPIQGVYKTRARLWPRPWPTLWLAPWPTLWRTLKFVFLPIIKEKYYLHARGHE